MVKRALSSSIALLAWLLPAFAMACPYCAAQDDKGSQVARFLLIGGLVSIPFIVSAVVVVVIRRAGRVPVPASESSPASQEAYP